MKAKAVFAGNARLIIRWTGAGWPGLESELKALLAKYELECTGAGYDRMNREWELVFRPAEARDE